METLSGNEYIYVSNQYRYFLKLHTENIDIYTNTMMINHGLQRVAIPPSNLNIIYKYYTLFKVIDKAKAFLFVISNSNMIEKPTIK
jgi:hypothetical protein